MAKVTAIQNNFNAGEFSPFLAGRVDIDVYKASVSDMTNMMPLIQGPAIRRPPTKYVASTKNSTGAAIFPFEFNDVQAYIVEAGEQYFRFYRNRGQILSGMSPYEISTPYTLANIFDTQGLFRLRITQSADVGYITHPSYCPRKLTRTNHTSWTLTRISFFDGPYLDINETSTTLTPSATSGTITLTASAALFASTDTAGTGGTGDMNRLIRLKDGSNWYWGRITGYTNNTTVTFLLEDGATLSGTSAITSWRLGSWSSTTGFPTCSTFYHDRLFYGGATGTPQRFDGSVVSDYDNFSPSATDGTVADDDAISRTLNANKVNIIRWLSDDEKGMVVGTLGGEWIVRPSEIGKAITPSNVQATQSTSYGSCNINPIKAGNATLFIQRSRRKLRELAYVYETDGFRAPDMSVRSEQISGTGFTGNMAYQQEPFSIVWLPRDDGYLIGFTYDRDQEVLAFHKHLLGGRSNEAGGGLPQVESVACIPSPDGSRDDLWVVVERIVNSQVVRHIEYLSEEFRNGDEQELFGYADSSLSYIGAPIQVVTGLTHLEGETVRVIADGGEHPDVEVDSGQITLNFEASRIHVGLPYTWRLKTQHLEAGSVTGTAQSKNKRISRLTVRFLNTLDVEYGPDDIRNAFIFRSSEDLMNNPPALFTGDLTVLYNNGYETSGSILLSGDGAFPVTIIAIMPEVKVEDS